MQRPGRRILDNSARSLIKPKSLLAASRFKRFSRQTN
jgi:hypothetical protein